MHTELSQDSAVQDVWRPVSIVWRTFSSVNRSMRRIADRMATYTGTVGVNTPTKAAPASYGSRNGTQQQQQQWQHGLDHDTVR